MQKLHSDIKNLLNISLNKQQIKAFEIFENELLQWNSQYNLTAIGDVEGIRTKHFLDSLSCLLAFNESPPGSLIDIGCGAGFPGIPLKILLPNIELTLVDSVGKKTKFCEHVVNTLSIDKTNIVQARAEELGRSKKHREKYDWATARAVSNLPVLVEYLLPLVRVGGSILAQKGESGPAEAHAAEQAIKLLGGHIRRLKKVTLPGVVEERYLIIIDKIATTPPQYPRRPGIPAKRPLTKT